MSWNKNTIRDNKLDNYIEVLESLDIRYELNVLGRVKALGINDSFNDIDEYEIRELSYENIVLKEQMIRINDCDMDDVIETFVFLKKNAPENWVIERIEEEEYSD